MGLTRLHHAPLMKYNYAVKIDDRVETMRNRDYSTTLEFVSDDGLHNPIGLDVDTISIVSSCSFGGLETAQDSPRRNLIQHHNLTLSQ